MMIFLESEISAKISLLHIKTEHILHALFPHLKDQSELTVVFALTYLSAE